MTDTLPIPKETIAKMRRLQDAMADEEIASIEVFAAGAALLIAELLVYAAKAEKALD